jgi:Ser/Thr protein kinase RdoA (MazF antagonist)
MEQELKEKFNNQIALEGARRFGVKLEELSYIGAWQNFIYEYQKHGKSYILRFTPSSHRSRNQIKGELDWIFYLDNHGVLVSRPIPSVNDQLTEIVKYDDLMFTVTSFVKAEGRKIGYPECLSDTMLFHNLGHITGKIHSLSKKYIPSDKNTHRHDWSKNYYLQNIEKFVPSTQPQIINSCQKLIEEIKETLIIDSNSYGLIHGDIGVGNFLINDRGITLFDFDEAQYSWFVEEISIPLYYLVYVYGGEEGKKDRESQANCFLEHFMDGYCRENSIDGKWLEKIPLFLKLREIIVYIGMCRSADLTQLNQWGLDFMAESKVRIENGIPIVNV